MELFPVRIVSRDPHGLGGACNAGWCLGDNGQHYALKDNTTHALTPHNEWFCTSLAEMIGVPCPPCAVIEDEHGAYLFGSRWEGGISPHECWELISRGDIPQATAFSALSRIFTFDCFVYNKDRHTGNYIVRDGIHSHVILAIDFDNAWLSNGFPLPELRFIPSANTRWFLNYLKDKLGDYIILNEVNLVLDRLKEAPATWIADIIKRHPDNWLPTTLRDQVLCWWDSAEKEERIEAIRKGISDGTFL